ncbi:MAG: hypothetical protein J0G96_07280 [Flavobacteriia bacterium]|nr:hypothetical protein [Flavobacteriia bacterium]
MKTLFNLFISGAFFMAFFAIGAAPVDLYLKLGAGTIYFAIYALFVIAMKENNSNQ